MSGEYPSPFSSAGVNEIIRRPRDDDRYVLTDNYQPPHANDLNRLTFALNSFAGLFKFARETAAPAKKQADDVREALTTLDLFFEGRRRTAASNPSAQIVEREERLRAEFELFLIAFQQHSFDLDMDASRLMPEHKNWHSVAEVIAGAFRIAMTPPIPARSSAPPMTAQSRASWLLSSL